jgi:MIP family channel proteins
MPINYTRHFYSEFIGTFALVFVGSGAIMVAHNGGSLLEVAVAHGLVLGIMVTAFMRIAAHFNPAVTIGFLFARRISPALAALHIVAQVIGAIVAAYALKSLFPAELYAASRGGGQSISTAVTASQAWVVEAIATFFLMTAIYGTAVDKRAPNVGGFGIGLVICFDILAFGPLTGASMNPARSLGPALVYGVFEAQIIYITAPIVGAVVAALAYEKLVLQGEREGEPVSS